MNSIDDETFDTLKTLPRPKPTVAELAKQGAKHWSTWFVTAVSLAGAYWVSLPAAEQAAHLARLPAPWMGPAASLLIFFALKVIPQQPKT